MTFVYMLFVIVIQFIGNVSHDLVDGLNGFTGWDAHGVVYFFLGWLIALIIDAILS